MSTTILTIAPSHPDANTTPYDVEHDLVITEFTGPAYDVEWIQLSIGDKSIRLSPVNIFVLTLALIGRMSKNPMEVIHMKPDSSLENKQLP